LEGPRKNLDALFKLIETHHHIKGCKKYIKGEYNYNEKFIGEQKKIFYETFRFMTNKEKRILISDNSSSTKFADFMIDVQVHIYKDTTFDILTEQIKLLE
jgi:hypothetical protein